MKTKAMTDSKRVQLERLIDAVALVIVRRQMKIYWR